MNLYQISNSQIKNNPFEYYPRFCLNPSFWSLPFKSRTTLKFNWAELKFNKKNSTKLNNNQGLYMFVVKPDKPKINHHSYILYVGEASNLKGRYSQYFKYVKSNNPSDQFKRRMIILWKKHLYFYYIKTSFRNRKEREKLEYDLIDSIIPPINDKFRSRIVKTQIKNIRNV